MAQTEPRRQDQAVTSLPYRSDIDGLRAIAVLAVVFYHFGIPGFQGGFVGVDIFFVISGFLIGGILWREYDSTGRIWLRHFYIRRFRRLAPAFFTMAFVTAALCWALFLPFEFRELGKQLIAATVYLSNVLFFREAGYFDTASEEKPFLHTWSLAVEEQFYIFLPLFMLLLSRNRRVLLAALVGCWVLSLAACVMLTARCGKQPTNRLCERRCTPRPIRRIARSSAAPFRARTPRRSSTCLSAQAICGTALLLFKLRKCKKR